MKLTWFSNRTFRAHLGGQIVVIEPGHAAAGMDRSELVSGADRVISFADDLVAVDALTWRTRRAERLLDAGESVRPVEVWSLEAGGLVLDADDERPFVVLSGEVPALGRWAAGSVIVLAGGQLVSRAADVLDVATPRLIALAGAEQDVDAAFAELAQKLDGVGLIALERGLAVEV